MVFASSGYSTGEELGHVLCAIVGFGSVEFWSRVRLPADKLPDAFASYRQELHRLRQDQKTKSRDKVDYSTASGVQAGDAQWASISEFVQSSMIPGTFARVSNWALARTALRYLGLVPAGCMVGDEVALLRGSSGPRVVRKQDTEMWEVLGAMYHAWGGLERWDV